jgi:outer membrane protein OmpA-like peptidoglycan-associated protein
VSGSKIVLAALVWLVLLAIGVGAWKFLLRPQQLAQQAAEQADQERQQAEQEQRIVKETEGTSRYKHNIACGVDAFSGYAVLRSAELTNELAGKGIRLTMEDDGADYAKRLAALEAGQLQFAAFPIDALIKACAVKRQLPVTIIAVIDETNGADAMVGYKGRYPGVDALNAADTQFVLVGDSPSETLARLVMRDFDLSKLGKSPLKLVASADELLKVYKAATPSNPQVFVTWEPYLSQLLENDQLHVLVDSSKFSGFIVDSLVVSRDYLLKNPSVVEAVLESYFKALSNFREPEKLQQLLLADAKLTGTALTDPQAARLVKGIRWKNTQENYAHFGLRQSGLPLIEDMVSRIARVLVDSKAIPADPTEGQPNRLYFDRLLANLQSAKFLPSEVIRTATDLPTLSVEQWKSLTPVGTLKVPEITFARGTATLTPTSTQTLDELATTLGAWPAYYLIVEGSTTASGNVVANQELAARRAEATVEYLRDQGIPASRMTSRPGNAGQSRVSFILGEIPY